MKQIGIGLHVFATSDPYGRLGNGAFDNLRDGCADRWSWVSNLRTIGMSEPGGYLCPKNQVRGMETINDLLDRETIHSYHIPPGRGWQDDEEGLCVRVVQAGDAKFRAERLGESLRSGLNTNYTSSWHHVRGQPRLTVLGLDDDLDGQVVVDTAPFIDTLHWDPAVAPATYGDDMRDFSNTTGPLTLAQVETAEVPASCIPLLGDAAPAEPSEVAPVDEFGEPAVRGLLVDEPLGRSFNPGPAFVRNPGEETERIVLVEASEFGGAQNRFVSIEAFLPTEFPAVGVDMSADDNESRYANAEPWTATNFDAEAALEARGRIVLQDLRGWAPVHGDRANVLMSDGSVKPITDANGDGFFNPGFAVTSSIAETTSYVDGTVEVNAFELYTGTFLTTSWCNRSHCGE